MNKKQIVKNAVAKYVGKGGPIKSSASTPFKMLGDLVKSIPINDKALTDLYIAKRKAKKANIDINTLKEARKYGNPASEEGGASSIVDGKITDAGKARAMAIEVKSRRMNQVKNYGKTLPRIGRKLWGIYGSIGK